MFEQEQDCEYEGEVYEDNEPCGFGCAIAEGGYKFRGTWLNGLAHGLCNNF